MSESIQFELSSPANKPHQDFLIKGLISENEAQIGPYNRKDYLITAMDNGVQIGGIWGQTHWNCGFVGQLYVSPSHQKKGVGKKLLEKFETKMRELKMEYCYLDTFSFQAPGFYLKLGYKKFGELHDYPPGNSRIFFVKKLN